MNTTKITKRDNLDALTALLTAAQNANITGFDYDALNTYVTNEIGLLNKKAAAAKARAEKTKAEGDALRDEVYGLLNDAEFTPIASLVAAINREDVTAQKITARLTQLVKLGKVEKSELTIENAEGKSRKVQGYRTIG